MGGSRNIWLFCLTVERQNLVVSSRFHEFVYIGERNPDNNSIYFAEHGLKGMGKRRDIDNTGGSEIVKMNVNSP